MVHARAAIEAAREYLRAHPEELARVLRSAAGLRFGVPLVALRWVGEQLEAQGLAKDVTIEAVPPGIRVGGSFALMHTPLRAAATMYFERIRISADELTFTVRLEDVSLQLDGNAQTPLAALIKSGALDTSKPGNLAAHMPNLPPVIVEARDNRLAFDLMRDPKLASHPLVRPLVGVITAFVTVRAVETDGDHLDVGFRALPAGVLGPAAALRQYLVVPALGRLLPGGCC